jgi:phosphatidylglycerophosphate synthase
MENTLPILVADDSQALFELCGVSLLERLLRILQRLGFRRAFVFLSTAAEIVGTEVAKRSWAREKVVVHVVSSATGPLTPQMVLEQGPSERFLVLPASIYCDARLLAALCRKDSSAALVDGNPPEFARPLIRNPCGPALVTKDFLSAFPAVPYFEQLKGKIDNREIDIVDAAEHDDYIFSMRRRVRPFCFPAPAVQNRRLAERVILDSAQNGTLDLPAYIHGPIETGIISLLCKTRITPNQITMGGFVIGCGATAAFVVGRVGLGILAALIFGIIDGLDGKQSRVKIETTERGKWEHHLDYLIENSWWLAIAFRLWRSGQFPNVFYFLSLLIASHLLTEFAKRRVKIARGRLLDDIAPFDRAFRLIAARRNVYVWILACGFLLGAFPQSYAIICGWAAISAAVHLARSILICDGAVRRFVGVRNQGTTNR